MTRFAVLAFAVLACTTLPLRAEGIRPRVRYSTTADTVRIVLDLPAECGYIAESTALTATVRIDTALPTALPAVTLTDPIVTGVQVTPDADGHAVMTVLLAKPRKYHLFTLAAEGNKPFRLVMDVLKRFKSITQSALTPAMQYTRLEEQTEDTYRVVHFVDVDARDPHVRLGVAAAEHERERVTGMVGRTGAVFGVNGGYFLTGTRPVGLLKVDGQVRSLPLWGRTAAAFPAAGPPVFAAPTGAWRVMFCNGAIRDIPDHLDGSVRVPPPTAEIFAGQTYTTVPANPHGLTAIIQGNTVIARTTAATPLTTDDFALVLSGDDLTAFDPALWDGAVTIIQPVLIPDWVEYPAAVGAGPRLLHEGKITITADTERFQPDIRLAHPARTAMGITADGHVIFAVVEAPCRYGGGATLEELATLLQQRGAVDAMNFDGGSSTQLAIGAQTVNYPPDTWIRPVACGVLVYDTRAQTSAAQ